MTTISQLKIKNVLIEKQSAELIALQNQIHPHFLFNTLESIRLSCRTGIRSMRRICLCRFPVFCG